MAEYIGLDVSKEETSYCIKDVTGEMIAHGKTATDPGSLYEAIVSHCRAPARVLLETGALSHWLAQGMRTRGLPVALADARSAHAIMRQQHNKTDANDARVLADLARTGYYREVAVRSAPARDDRALLKARAHLVQQRRDMDNAIRGLLRSFGVRIAKGKGKFDKRVRAALEHHPDLTFMIEPLLKARASLSASLAELDAQVKERAESNPACVLLMSVPGVGSVTALAFAATIDDPARFANSRAVGAYLGLTTRRWQSGEMDTSGRISRQGDAMLRSLLYEAANCMLTRTRRAHPLKDWARRLKKRSSHKKACTALARKLAVIMHSMLMNGEYFRDGTNNKDKEVASA